MTIDELLACVRSEIDIGRYTREVSYKSYEERESFLAEMKAKEEKIDKLFKLAKPAIEHILKENGYKA